MAGMSSLVNVVASSAGRKKFWNIVTLGVHVDDPIITGPNLEDILKLEEQLNARFPFKALGEVSYYLGTTIERNWGAGTIVYDHTS